ncbi:putative Six-hairpin glycosidase [Seiridium cardinale]
MGPIWCIINQQTTEQPPANNKTDRRRDVEEPGVKLFVRSQLVRISDEDREDSLIRNHRFLCTRLQRADGYSYNGAGVTKLQALRLPLRSPNCTCKAPAQHDFLATLRLPHHWNVMCSLSGTHVRGKSNTISQSLNALKDTGSGTACDKAFGPSTSDGDPIAEIAINYPASEANHEP